MSDFYSSFWPIFIAVISIGGIIGCAILLWKTAKVKKGDGDHVWDENLRELDNPLPGWWVGMFAITVVFGLIYLFAYPGSGVFAGQLGWTQAKQYEQEIAEANEALKPVYAKFAALDTPALAKNPEAHAIGERLFMNNCAQCHGSDARGSRGFPNLTDTDWLYGGEPEAIQQSITNGRIGMMPPMAALVGNESDIKNLANYVLSLSNAGHDKARAELGKEKFALCAACHGPEGKGMTAVGAPNLTDNVWLHGAGEAAIIKRIHEGKNNQMPAWESKFTPEQIKVLTAYVWGFSNK